MHQITIPDEAYAVATRRATEQGFASPDAFVTERLLGEGWGDLEVTHADVQQRFTPEVISYLNRITAEIDSGAKTYSMAEVDAHFEEKRRAWLENRVN